jgi:hypothetical protein
MKKILLLIAFIAMSNTITAKQTPANYKKPAQAIKTNSNQIITFKKPDLVRLNNYKSFTKPSSLHLINILPVGSSNNKEGVNPLKSNRNYKTNFSNNNLKKSTN